MLHMLQPILKKERRLAIGLMSGTSLDGIDAALVEIKGDGLHTNVHLMEFATLPFDPNFRGSLLELCSPDTSTVEKICVLNVRLGHLLSEAAKYVTGKAGLTLQEIDFISSHGQTIYHMPESYATLQIGELAIIAEETGCLTVGDFRPSDMAAGGQGAPLVPYVDYLLFGRKNMGRILLNIGGISNITVIPQDAMSNQVIAFDTGPGNVLIDSLVKIGTGGKLNFDKDGMLALKGMVQQKWLTEMLAADLYLPKSPPKSTGRELYTLEFAKKLMCAGQEQGFSFEDIIATVSKFTVEMIAKHIHQFVDGNITTGEVLVGGGGVHNPFIMENLGERLSQKVVPMESIGYSSDAKESIAFAVLGNEFLYGNTNNLPSATGAKHPVIMGKLTLPST